MNNLQQIKLEIRNEFYKYFIQIKRKLISGCNEESYYSLKQAKEEMKKIKESIKLETFEILKKKINKKIYLEILKYWINSLCLLEEIYYIHKKK